MCINFETSIVSFLIGEISGYILTRGNNDKKGIGFFVMYYSLIQFFEIFIHKFGDKTKILSNLHLLNLGTQSFAFFLFMKYISNKNVENSYLLLSFMIAIITIIKVLTFKHKIIKEKCLDYNLKNDYIDKFPFLNYLLITIYMLSSDSKYINKSGFLLLLTLLCSFILAKIRKTNEECASSYWCNLSAILAPIFNII